MSILTFLARFVFGAVAGGAALSGTAAALAWWDSSPGEGLRLSDLDASDVSVIATASGCLGFFYAMARTIEDMACE